MEAFVEAPSATEHTPAETFQFLDVFVLIFAVFEERRPRQGLREEYLSLVLDIGMMTWRENDERARIYKQKTADCGWLPGLRSSTVTQQFSRPVYPNQMCFVFSKPAHKKP